MIAKTLPRTLALAAMLLGSPSFAASSFPPPEVIGEWQGESDISSTWCRQTSLAVHLFIRADAKVSGSVGDALIAAGSIRKNNWFLVWLGKPEYVVEASLDGPLVGAEDIRRRSIELLLDVNGHELEGSFQTSGTAAGGKESMSMSGTSLVLSRVQRLNTEVGEIRLRKLIGKERIRDRDLCGVAFREENTLAQRAENHHEAEIDGKIRRRVPDFAPA